MKDGRIRLKLLGYLNAARPNGQDVETLVQGLHYDGFRENTTKDTIRHELNLMADDGFVKSKMDALTKERLLWHITDDGIQVALENAV